MNARADKQVSPVLVTGSHRSGTTWFGRMLSLSGELAPIHEPFNPANRWSWLSGPPEHWYQYVADEASDQFRSDMEQLISLRYPLKRMSARVKSSRQMAAVGRDFLQTLNWRREGRALLMKDPLAFFSTDWITDNFGLRAVICVRHPAAFVSSIKRLDWVFDFSNWADQPVLLNGPLADYAEEISAYASKPPDIIDQGILMWRAINGVVCRDHKDRSGQHVVRYEDFASEPVARFRELYGELDLRWTRQVEKSMRDFTDGTTGEMSAGQHMAVRRDSQSAMWTWLDRLNDREIERIRIGTDGVARQFYSDEDWIRD